MLYPKLIGTTDENKNKEITPNTGIILLSAVKRPPQVLENDLKNSTN
jgi:hypothetical protein